MSLKISCYFTSLVSNMSLIQNIKDLVNKKGNLKYLQWRLLSLKFVNNFTRPETVYKVTGSDVK